MAQFQFDIARLGHTDEVAQTGGSSISTSAVRVTIDDTNAGSKQEAIRQIRAIADRVAELPWPPA